MISAPSKGMTADAFVNSLSPCVQNMLNKWHLEYELVPTSDFLPHAHGVLLEDNSGRVQVVAPADALIDLTSLNQELKRHLRSVPVVQQALFHQQLKIERLTALPMALGLQTIVDRKILNEDVVYLDSGNSNFLIKTRVELLEKLPSSAVSFGNFAVSAPTMQDHTPVTTGSESPILVNGFNERRIGGRLEDTIDLPPLPATAQGLLQLLANPDSNIEELIRVVEVDPSLAAQVISWAQSPYYAAPGKIHSIHDAVTRVLGYDMVLNLALGLALSKTLRLPKEGVNGNLSFWEQSVYTAALMEGLVRAMPTRKRPPVGMAYLTGLLHNFGYLLLAELFPPHFNSFCRYMEVNSHLNYFQVEKFLLQTDRTQMGFSLMQQWGLPEEVCQAIRHQNLPSYRGCGDTLAKMLLIVTRLLRRYQSTDIADAHIPARLLTELNLEEELLEEMGDAVFGKQEQLQIMVRQLSH